MNNCLSKAQLIEKHDFLQLVTKAQAPEMRK